jgi:hypothetical protein
MMRVAQKVLKIFQLGCLRQHNGSPADPHLSLSSPVLTSVDTLSGEIASGTIHTLVAKPLRRWEIVLGKWLGFSGMLTLYLLLMAGGVVTVVYLVGGYAAPNGTAYIYNNTIYKISPDDTVTPFATGISNAGFWDGGDIICSSWGDIFAISQQPPILTRFTKDKATLFASGLENDANSMTCNPSGEFFIARGGSERGQPFTQGSRETKGTE